MRAIWKGSISFGLVNIPVGLYSVTRPDSKIKRHICRETDLSPIRYQRIAEADGEEVSRDQVIKTYEYEKGEFVPLSDAEIESIEGKPQAQMIEIQEFVSPLEISPVFRDKIYYVGPEP